MNSPGIRDFRRRTTLSKFCWLQGQQVSRVKIGKQVNIIDVGTMARLRAYSWPGNVRELENVIERAIMPTEGSALQFDESFDWTAKPVNGGGQKTLKDVEQQMINNPLQDAGWKIDGQNSAAIHLGMAPSTLRERIKRYGVKRSPFSFETDYFPH